MSKTIGLRYDPRGAFLPRSGISRDDLAGLGGRLETARRETLADVPLFAAGGSLPRSKQPLDSAFIDLPERLLTAYREQREASELGRILKTAARLRDAVDRVVVLGSGGTYRGARALMEACCEPYFNELSRAERGSRPRMYFEGNNVDNDATQGLLRLLGDGRPANHALDRWAIVVIGKGDGTLETAAFRQLLTRLRSSCGHNAGLIGQLVVPVTDTCGRLSELAQALHCVDLFSVPEGVGGRFSVLSAVGLLPAAILGLNVIQLLEGAAAMTEHFRAAPPGRNVVLDYVGVAHLLEELRGATIRVLSVWAKALEAVGLWYDQLLAESLGKAERGATPLTTVNLLDLHSRAQQHLEGRRDKLITNLTVDRWRCDPLAVEHGELHRDKPNASAERTLPELMAAAIQGANEAYHEDGRPTAEIHLPDTSETSIGEFFQMMMLANVVEGRLLGINPYGQPGVEKYNKNMNRILGR